MILNPIKCEGCGRELQPEDILVGNRFEAITRVCAFCGYEELVD